MKSIVLAFLFAVSAGAATTTPTQKLVFGLTNNSIVFVEAAVSEKVSLNEAVYIGKVWQLPLEYALKNNNVEISRFLISSGARTGTRPLSVSILDAKKEMLVPLLEQVIQVGEPLHQKGIVKRNAWVNGKFVDSVNTTLISELSRRSYEYLEVASVLAKHVNLLSQDPSSFTYFARILCWSNEAEAVLKELFEKKAEGYKTALSVLAGRICVNYTETKKIKSKTVAVYSVQDFSRLFDLALSTNEDIDAQHPGHVTPLAGLFIESPSARLDIASATVSNGKYPQEILRERLLKIMQKKPDINKVTGIERYSLDSLYIEGTPFGFAAMIYSLGFSLGDPLIEEKLKLSDSYALLAYKPDVTLPVKEVRLHWGGQTNSKPYTSVSIKNPTLYLGTEILKDLFLNGLKNKAEHGTDPLAVFMRNCAGSLCKSAFDQIVKVLGSQLSVTRETYDVIKSYGQDTKLLEYYFKTLSKVATQKQLEVALTRDEVYSMSLDQRLTYLKLGYEGSWLLYGVSDQSVLKKLLSTGTDINKAYSGPNPDLYGKEVYCETPLYYAVRKNDVKLAKFLISKGANPLIGGCGKTTLTYSAFANPDGFYREINDNIEMAKLLTSSARFSSDQLAKFYIESSPFYSKELKVLDHVMSLKPNPTYCLLRSQGKEFSTLSAAVWNRRANHLHSMLNSQNVDFKCKNASPVFDEVATRLMDEDFYLTSSHKIKAIDVLRMFAQAGSKLGDEKVCDDGVKMYGLAYYGSIQCPFNTVLSVRDNEIYNLQKQFGKNPKLNVNLFFQYKDAWDRRVIIDIEVPLFYWMVKYTRISVPMVQEFINDGVNVNWVSKYHPDTALDLAIKYNNLPLAEYLYGIGALRSSEL